MNENSKAKNSMGVTVTLSSGEVLNGKVNTLNYKRFSDFIENHNEKNIKLYHSTRVDNISGSTTKFLLIPKTNISYYEPFDEKRNL
jgi:hypothetical protein